MKKAIPVFIALLLLFILSVALMIPDSGSVDRGSCWGCTMPTIQEECAPPEMDGDFICWLAGE